MPMFLANSPASLSTDIRVLPIAVIAPNARVVGSNKSFAIFLPKALNCIAAALALEGTSPVTFEVSLISSVTSDNAFEDDSPNPGIVPINLFNLPATPKLSSIFFSKSSCFNLSAFCFSNSLVFLDANSNCFPEALKLDS